MLAGFHRHGAHENGPAFAVNLFHLIEHRLIFFLGAEVNGIIAIFAHANLIGGDNEHAHTVNIKKLVGLGLGGASHPGEFEVQPEIILNGNGGVSLRLGFDADAFFGFHGLVQPVAPAAPFHRAAGVFVHDHHFVFRHDVLLVALVKAIGLEQLRGDVNAFTALFALGLHALFFGKALLRREVFVGIDFVMRGDHVGHHKSFGVAGAEKFAALLGEIGIVTFLVHCKIEMLLLRVQLFLGLVFVQLHFGVGETAQVIRIRLEFQQSGMLGLAELGAIH